MKLLLEEEEQKREQLLNIVPEKLTTSKALMNRDRQNIYTRYESYKSNLEKLAKQDKIVKEESQYTNVVHYKRK